MRTLQQSHGLEDPKRTSLKGSDPPLSHQEHGDNPTAIPRKRARQACSTCHGRKVRCDLAVRGVPCSNCKEDGTPELCRLHVRKVRRLSKSQNTSIATPLPTEHRDPSLNYVVQQGDTPGTASSSGPNAIRQNNDRSFGTRDRTNVPRVGDDFRQEMCTQPFQSTVSYPDQLLPNPNPFLEADFSDFAGLDTIFDVTDGYSMGGSTSWEFDPSRAAPGQLPINIESPPVSWTSTSGNAHTLSSLREDEILSIDAEFIKNQGCFILPKSPTLCRLMMVFFRFAHPNLPIINEAAFWKLWPVRSEENFQVGSFSVLVLQAMCFVASNYASEDLLCCCGFKNGLAARAGFFRRAKLMFDFGCETNPVSLSQAALMLSYYTPKGDLLRRNTQWLDQAIFFARVARADRYYSEFNTSRGSKNTSVLKRLWWGCILRDRIQPLGLRRPIIIASIEPEVDFLTEQDFEDEIGQSRVHEVSTQSQIFRIISLMCKLAHQLTPVMDTLFSIESSDERSRTTPETLPIQLAHTRQLKEQLRGWFNEASSVFPPPISLGDTSDSITVAANMMFIYYNTAILCLCHHQMLLWETRNPSSTLQIHYETPINEIVNAVDKTTERVRELVQLNLVASAPISLSAFLCFPILLQAISAKAASGAQLERAARRQLEIYLRAMRYQQNINPGTDHVSSLVDKIVSYAIDDQMLNATTSSPSLSADTPAAQEDRDTGSFTLTNPMRIGLSRRSNHDSSSSGEGDGYGAIKGWGELLETKPRFYLRLALHIDWSLLTGRPPEEGHFPAALRRSRPPAQPDQPVKTSSH